MLLYFMVYDIVWHRISYGVVGLYCMLLYVMVYDIVWHRI